jgi:hypothetical protein
MKHIIRSSYRVSAAQNLNDVISETFNDRTQIQGYWALPEVADTYPDSNTRIKEGV